MLTYFILFYFIYFTHQQQQTRRNLLHHALHAHSTLTREAATGRGIDRHLLGLRLMLRPLNGEQAALFEDELFARSQRWTLSTSGLSAGNLFKGTGCAFAFFTSTSTRGVADC
jgi:carnitine O-acetyltransferase